jgi:hypothetical protein
MKEIPSIKEGKVANPNKRPDLPNASVALRATGRPDFTATLHDTRTQSFPIGNLTGPRGTNARMANVSRFDQQERDGRVRNVDPNAAYDDARGLNNAGGRLAPGGYLDDAKNTRTSDREMVFGDLAFDNRAPIQGESGIGPIGQIRESTLRQVPDGYAALALGENRSQRATAAAKGVSRADAYARSTQRVTDTDYFGNAAGHTKPLGPNGVSSDMRGVRMTGRESLGVTSYTGNGFSQNPRAEDPSLGRNIDLPPQRNQGGYVPGPQARYRSTLNQEEIGRDGRDKPQGLPTRDGQRNGVQKRDFTRQMGQVTTVSGDSQNCRALELNLARKQLENNPYAMPVFG